MFYGSPLSLKRFALNENKNKNHQLTTPKKKRKEKGKISTTPVAINKHETHVTALTLICVFRMESFLNILRFLVKLLLMKYPGQDGLDVMEQLRSPSSTGLQC